MCRYAMSGPYKRHYACFSCRKAFKQPPIEDYLEVSGRGYIFKQLQPIWASKMVLARREDELGHRLSDLIEEYRNATHKCPECGELMIDMGLDFKPPRQSDEKAWNVLRGMYRVGHAFQTCGCNGPGWISSSKSEYCDYLASMKKHYEEQLTRVQQSSEHSSEVKKIEGEYWGARIEAIERERTGSS